MDERIKQQLLLGREHFAKREYDRAEQFLRQVLEQDDRFADVHDMLGIIAHTRGNFTQAERHFERALEINPSYTEAALNLAVTYNDRGKYEAARELYTRIKARPTNTVQGLDPFARGKLANMHADLAHAYIDLGLLKEGIEELKRAVTMGPQFADLRTRLGTLLRDAGDLDGALEQIEAAVAARPGYVPARVQLGITLLAAGRAGDAEREWNKALEIEPDNTQVKMHLRTLKVAQARSSAPPPPSGSPGG